jgi:hypothetical protein
MCNIFLMRILALLGVIIMSVLSGAVFTAHQYRSETVPEPGWWSLQTESSYYVYNSNLSRIYIWDKLPNGDRRLNKAYVYGAYNIRDQKGCWRTQKAALSEEERGLLSLPIEGEGAQHKAYTYSEGALLDDGKYISLFIPSTSPGHIRLEPGC